MFRGVKGWWRAGGALLSACAAMPAGADSIRTPDWAVHFNLPDQDNLSPTSADLNEWSIRDALLERLNALQAGQEACLATYTFLGSETCCGAAGPVLTAVNAALDRGASVRMVIDGGVLAGTTYGAYSLAGLAARPVNPLDLEEDDSAGGIMHDKLGIFDYGPGNRWVFVASWNFTGGACSYQWNIGLELRSDALHAAYRAEFTELLAGRFHDHPTKSRAHDGTRFAPPGGWTNGWVRFSPPRDSSTGGNNPLRDITNTIGLARSEIVFALNLVTRLAVSDQLIAAANRGVSVTGVLPREELDPADDSYPVYQELIDPANYTTTNRTRILTAYAKADGSALDSGESDLVHAKYMVIDPFGERPWLIHGSANWSASALVFTNSNDENVLFVPHRELARLFYAHFKRATGAFAHRGDSWWDLAPADDANVARLWATDTNALVVETAPQLTGPWTAAATNHGHIGFATYTNTAPAPTRFLRATRP